MASRNYGLGHRDLARAGQIALQTRSGLSFSSIATISERWGEFCRWARGQGIHKMEKISRESLLRYGMELAEKTKSGEMSAATAQNYVSAVNRVMELARGDPQVRVSPTRECGIPRRTGLATASRAISGRDHEHAQERLSERAGALLELQRYLGLRFKESALLDASRAFREASVHGSVRIVDGAKGGRERSVPITGPEQLAALERAAALQDGRSMVPRDERYIDFARACYREFSDWHGERHAYAQARYEALMGAPCPVAAGVRHGPSHFRFLAGRLGLSVEAAREKDREVRQRIAEELGHGRPEITHSYLG